MRGFKESDLWRESGMPLLDYNPNSVVALLLLAVIVSVGVYDVFAGTYFGQEWTVTTVVQGWSARYPALPLLVGFILGHLFWR
jgi:TRAP-type C4-dicarboxylate transport system permease small subunit